jgi:hypothetical protein
MLTEVAQEERRQRVAKIERVKAVERGEDPARVRLEGSTKTKEGPIDEDSARLGL